MADGKIYITISDTRGGSGKGSTTETKTEKEKESVVGEYLRHRFFNFAESQAKQAVNYSVGNIGNFTGNYQTQRDAEVALSALSWVVNLGTAVYSGFKVGQIPGAIAAAVVSVGSGLINVAYREYTESFQNRKDNRNIEMMRNRLGLQGLTDGSRTGGY